MNFLTLKRQANDLFSNAAFITQIQNEEDYELALSLMDELTEEYDLYKPLIDILSNAIEKWENTSPEFLQFNSSIAQMDSGIAVLTILMQQYGLKTGDFKNEIGDENAVRMILDGTCKLSLEHMQALVNRFHINPSVFFEQTQA